MWHFIYLKQFLHKKIYIVFNGHKSLFLKFMTSPMTSSVCKHLKVCVCLDSLQTILRWINLAFIDALNWRENFKPLAKCKNFRGPYFKMKSLFPKGLRRHVYQTLVFCIIGILISRGTTYQFAYFQNAFNPLQKRHSISRLCILTVSTKQMKLLHCITWCFNKRKRNKRETMTIEYRSVLEL